MNTDILYKRNRKSEFNSIGLFIKEGKKKLDLKYIYFNTEGNVSTRPYLGGDPKGSRPFPSEISLKYDKLLTLTNSNCKKILIFQRNFIFSLLLNII